MSLNLLQNAFENLESTEISKKDWDAVYFSLHQHMQEKRKSFKDKAIQSLLGKMENVASQKAKIDAQLMEILEQAQDADLVSDRRQRGFMYWANQYAQLAGLRLRESFFIQMNKVWITAILTRLPIKVSKISKINTPGFFDKVFAKYKKQLASEGHYLQQLETYRNSLRGRIDTYSTAKTLNPDKTAFPEVKKQEDANPISNNMSNGRMAFSAIHPARQKRTKICHLEDIANDSALRLVNSSKSKAIDATNKIKRTPGQPGKQVVVENNTKKEKEESKISYEDMVPRRRTKYKHMTSEQLERELEEALRFEVPDPNPKIKSDRLIITSDNTTLKYLEEAQPKVEACEPKNNLDESLSGSLVINKRKTLQDLASATRSKQLVSDLSTLSLKDPPKELSETDTVAMEHWIRKTSLAACANDTKGLNPDPEAVLKKAQTLLRTLD